MVTGRARLRHTTGLLCRADGAPMQRQCRRLLCDAHRAPRCSRGVLTVPSRGSAAAPAARQHTRCTPGCRRVMFTVNVSLRRNITGQREEMKGKKRCQNDEMTWCNIEGNLPDPSNCTLGGGCGTDFRTVYHIKEVGWTQSRPRAQRTWTSDRALVLLIA